MSAKTTLARRRRPLAVLAAGALAASGLVAVAGPAAAAIPYTIDGDNIGNGLDPVYDGHDKDKELGPVNGSDTKLGVIHSADVPMLSDTNPNGQTDLWKTWVQTDGDTEDSTTWMYFAWERDSSNGSGVITYEFHQDASPCIFSVDGEPVADQDLIDGCNPWSKRQPGDFLIVWDQQGTDITLWLRYFEDPAPDDGVDWQYGDPLTLQTPGVNLSAIGAQAAVSADGFSGEAAINLNTSGIFGEGECTSLGNVIPGTVTGNSDTADYKDTVLGYGVNISNCGTVKVRKVSDVTDGSNSFPYTLDRFPTDQDIRYDSFTDYESATGSLEENGAYVTEADLLPGDDYFLTEDLTGLTYDLESITCTAPLDSDAAEPTYPGDFTDTVAVDGSDTFAVNAGEVTYCVISNTLQTGTLKVKKDVVDSFAGGAGSEEFSYQLTSPDGSAGDLYDGAFAAGEAFDTYNDLTAGEYTLEEVGDLPSGYEFDSIVCSNDAQGSSTANGRTVVVEPGGTTTCTVTNTDLPGTLKIRKVVEDSFGGGAASEEFDYQLTTPGGTAGDVYDGAFAADEAFDTYGDLSSGEYTLEETGLASDIYEFDSIVCSNDAEGASTDNGRTVTVVNGETTECVVTNTDTIAQPTGETNQSWVLHDSIAISGIRAGAPNAGDADVTFTLYSDAECSVVVNADDANPVSDGSAATDEGVSVDEPGTYYWIASYSGDAYNQAFDTTCGDEITVIQAKDVDDSLPE